MYQAEHTALPRRKNIPICGSLAVPSRRARYTSQNAETKICLGITVAREQANRDFRTNSAASDCKDGSGGLTAQWAVSRFASCEARYLLMPRINSAASPAGR